MDRLSDKRHKHIRRRRRIRKKILGTSERPRLSVSKSHKNISVQIVDDMESRTLVSVSTLEKDMSGVRKSVEGGKMVGLMVGKRLKAIDVGSVVFDRNGYRYHGVVKAVADGVREAGLEF